MSKKDEEIVEALTKVKNNQYAFETVEMTFKKKSIEEILLLSENVDTDKAAEEVLQWLIENVENYIDNKEREFRIDLVIEENSSENMVNIKLLQDLYRAIPDDSEYVDVAKIEELMKGDLNEAFEDEDFEKLVHCRETLDNISFTIHDKMRDPENLKKLYERMIYFYEMIGIKDSTPLLQSFNGGVDIIEFQYESFSIGVNVLEGRMSLQDDINAPCKKETIKNYIVPEGFSILLEISFMDSSRSLSIF